MRFLHLMDCMVSQQRAQLKDGENGMMTETNGWTLWPIQGPAYLCFPHMLHHTYLFVHYHPNPTRQQMENLLNERSQKFARWNNERGELTTQWEVSGVHRPLASVSKMLEADNVVWFSREDYGGTGLYNRKTGKTMKLFLKDGIFVLPAWVRGAAVTGGSTAGSSGPSGFTRPAARL